MFLKCDGESNVVNIVILTRKQFQPIMHPCDDIFFGAFVEFLSC